MSQTPHNPRNINTVAGGMGVYSDLREARIGRLNNQPVPARRLMAHTNAMNMAALRSKAACIHEYQISP
jgi:hypothetical protein